jgi:alkylation response protein AidB-like acyl-CoA dehydrogenase
MILSEKHQMMQKLFRGFARAEFTQELLDNLEATGEFNRDIHHKMAKAGFMGAKIPVEYGGQGGDNLAYVLMVEELARVSPVLSLYANTPTLSAGGRCLLRKTRSRSKKYLPPLAGRRKILVYALRDRRRADAEARGQPRPADGHYLCSTTQDIYQRSPFADYALSTLKQTLHKEARAGNINVYYGYVAARRFLRQAEHKMGDF